MNTPITTMNTMDNEMIRYTKKSIFTGDVNTLEIDMDPEEFRGALEAWQGGVLIQDAFPGLTNEEREFIMTGMTMGEWEKAFE